MGWINFDKTKPGENKHYIVYDPSSEVKVFPAYWDGKEFGNYVALLDWYPYENIKAWMVLPEPPTDL